MELAFVFAALKRRWWVIPLFIQLGLQPFIFGTSAGESYYEAQSLLKIVAPDDAPPQYGSADRYILSQLEVLNGSAMASAVADDLGEDYSPEMVAEAATVVHRPATDIAAITVQHSDPDVAFAIANAYGDLYISQLVAEEEAIRNPKLERIEVSLAQKHDELDLVNNEIKVAMAPYLKDRETKSVPQESAVVPEQVIGRGLILDEIAILERDRNELANAASGINSEIVQIAFLPTESQTPSSLPLKVAFLLAMTLVGVAVALMWARFSPRVIDGAHAGEILSSPIVSKVGSESKLRSDPLTALVRLPQSHISEIDQLCVQAEALADINQTLLVVVVGSQRGAGCTTTAVSMSARFSAAEFSVVTVDADRRDPWLSDAVGAFNHGGIPALLGLDNADQEMMFTHSYDHSVRFLGLGSRDFSLRRENVPQLVAGLRMAAQIIVVDAGPLLDSATTVELCAAADAVVLCVPVEQQMTRDLEPVSRQLRRFLDKVLVIHTSPTRGEASRKGQSQKWSADSRGLDGILKPPTSASSAKATSESDVARPTAGLPERPSVNLDVYPDRGTEANAPTRLRSRSSGSRTVDRKKDSKPSSKVKRPSGKPQPGPPDPKSKSNPPKREKI